MPTHERRFAKSAVCHGSHNKAVSWDAAACYILLQVRLCPVPLIPFFDEFADKLSDVLESVKDVPVETVATAGLVFIAAGAIAVKAIGAGANGAIEAVKDVIHATPK